MKKVVISIISVALLAGCSSSLPSQYTCESDQSFEAMLTSDLAIIRFNGEEKELPRIRSASGVQYQSDRGNTGFYGKGNEAMLVWGDITLRECELQ
ncbi:MliC family protein [Enterovibrio sp. ZSDZ35]|uniref:MliC family protein n=1 Tax=Enterovibrio qingdaonensis TaxID=2899818 RepID=A0ABT5QTE0_9GAMM|nr:MliC family protein [Enterovibrio sp. ZSDZ35]MDD1784241.1 MliC family protein [Enterovibrio sp. ZSDZ35]